MSIDLKDFFNENQHYEKIKRGAQKIRSEPSSIHFNLYLHDLLNYFIKDIGIVAKQIHEEALLKRSTNEMKVKPLVAGTLSHSEATRMLSTS
ncbi:MAG TPA: hypothetical protein VD770_02060 [Coxiellaceae bacterium]|nr:hypothetical protein [Coxiellaceae bacterium]